MPDQRVRNIRIAARKLLRAQSQNGPALGLRAVSWTGGEEGDLWGSERTRVVGDIITIVGSVMITQGPGESFSGLREGHSRGTVALAWDMLPESLSLTNLDDLVGLITKMSGQLSSSADMDRTELLVGQGNGWRHVLSIEHAEPDRQADVVTFSVLIAPPTPNTEPPASP